MAKRPIGLRRDPKSGVYYLRRRIPTSVLSCYPCKTEITRSLRTKDFQTAQQRLRKEDVQLAREWEHCRQRLADEAARAQARALTRIDVMSAEIIEALCQRMEVEALAGDEARRLQTEDAEGKPLDKSYTLEEIQDYQQGYAQANQLLKVAIATGDIQALQEPLQQWLQLHRYEVDASEADMRRLTLAYARTMLRINNKLLSRYEGNDEPTPQSSNKLDTPRLSEVTQAYVVYYAKLGKVSMIRKVKAVLELLVHIVGDKPIGALRQSDLNIYFEAVQSLPPRWRDQCRKHKVTPGELAKRQLGEITKDTFDGTYLAVFNPFVRYCRHQWQDQGWPMTLTVEGVQYTGGRRKSEYGQRAFTPTELKRLFEGAEMAAFAKDPDQAHKFWLPHLGLFTGARVNELCQLNPQTDVRRDEVSGIWFLDVTDESGADDGVRKSVKTAGSRRKIPIHSTLIELGLLEYVTRVKAQGAQRLLPGFPVRKAGVSAEARKWFGQFLGRIGLRDQSAGAQIVGMHAFRHTFLARAAELEVVNASALTGHVSNISGVQAVQGGQVQEEKSAVVRRYEGELPVHKKREILERMHFGALRFYKPVQAKPDHACQR